MKKTTELFDKVKKLLDHHEERINALGFACGARPHVKETVSDGAAPNHRSRSPRDENYKEVDRASEQPDLPTLRPFEHSCDDATLCLRDCEDKLANLGVDEAKWPVYIAGFLRDWSLLWYRREREANGIKAVPWPKFKAAFLNAHNPVTKSRK